MRTGIILLACALAITLHPAMSRAYNSYDWTGVQDDLWANGENWALRSAQTPRPTRTNPQQTDWMYLFVPQDLSSTSCQIEENDNVTISNLKIGGVATMEDAEGPLTLTPMTLDLVGTLNFYADGQWHGQGRDLGNFLVLADETYGASTVNIGWSGVIHNRLAAPNVGALNVQGKTHTIEEGDQDIRSAVNQYDGFVEVDDLALWGGEYNLVDGTLETGQTGFNGAPPHGIFNQTGGEHNTGYIGLFYSGVYDLSGGFLTVAPDPKQAFCMIDIHSGNFIQTGGLLDAQCLLDIQQGTARLEGGEANLGSILIGSSGNLLVGSEGNDKTIYITDCLYEHNANPLTAVSLSLGGTYTVLGSSCTFLFSRGQEGRDILYIQTGNGVDPEDLDLGNTIFQFDKGFTDPILDAFADDVDENHSLQDIYSTYRAEHYVLGGLIVGADDATSAMPLLLEGDPGTAFFVADLQIRNRGYITYLNDANGHPIVVPLYFLDESGNPQEFFPGDTDLNGGVTFSDYTILEQNFGGTGKTWAQGDFNGDGHVSFADYTILEQNFGKHYQGQMAENRSNAQSSEPTSLPTLTDLNGDGKIDDEDMLLLFQQIDGQGQD